MSSRLAPTHYDELLVGSGISPEVIKARGAYTEFSRAGLRELGFADYQAIAPALVLPVHSLNGWEPTYYIKPNSPRTPPGKNKPLKYEYPEGAPNRLDVPAATAAVADDPSVPVMITEGIKKVDAARSAGYHCIGLGGVWNWLGKHDTPNSMPIPDFGYFVWKGRKVAIVFDSDVATNKNVREARRRLKLFLESLGAIVYFIDLAPAADGSKVGLDDYLLTHPDARLWDMAYDPDDAEAAKLRTQLAEERRIKANMLYALRNKKIKAERMTLVATVNYLEAKHATEPPVELPGKGGGWYAVPRAAIAEQAGCSPDTAGGHLDSGAKWGVIEKTLDWDPRERVDKETGELLPPDGPKRIWMRRTRPASETLGMLMTLDPPKQEGQSDWGGKREVTCPDHPNAGTVKKWTLHCQECDRALDSGKTFQRPKYQDDTPPDEHAEELVSALQEPTRQDDVYPESVAEVGTRQDDVPSKEGDTYDPPATPIRHLDVYPPAHPDDAALEELAARIEALVFGPYRVGRSTMQLAKDTAAPAPDIGRAVALLVKRGRVACRGPYKLVEPIPLTTPKQPQEAYRG